MTKMEIANLLRSAAELLREGASWSDDPHQYESTADECDRAAVQLTDDVRGGIEGAV